MCLLKMSIGSFVTQYCKPLSFVTRASSYLYFQGLKNVEKITDEVFLHHTRNYFKIMKHENPRQYLVIENDELPNCICKTCSMKIVRAFEFRQLAKRSNEILRRFVQDKAFKKKQEQAEKQLHSLFHNKNGSLRQIPSEQLEVEPLAYCVKVEHEDEDENGLECDNDELSGEQSLIADVDPSASMMDDDDDSEEDPAGLPNDEMMEHEFEPAWMNNGNDDSQPEGMGQKNPWNCQYCNTTFPNEERFKRHSLIHTSEPPFPCDYCDESFDLRTDLKAHWRVHSDGNPHICQMCGKSFPDRMSYLQHSDLHDQVKPYRCPVCKKSFCYGSDLRKHAITHTGVRPYVCSVCGNSFTRSTSLNKHLRMHNGNRPFKCPACPKIFGSRGDLKRHQIIHSGIKPWICTVCSVPFNRKDKLVRHEKLHSGEPRPFQCYECPTSFSRKEDLTKHIQFHHYKPPADMENVTSNGNNTETIENSALDQISKSDLERGNRTFRALIKEAFSGNQGWNQSTAAATPVSATLTISSVSSPAVAAATPAELKEESPFKCDICHKRFTHKASLDAHQKIHTAIKPFGCSMCEKSFYRRRELSRHEAVHTGYKPYSCGVCGKCFSRTDKLNRHVQTHQYKSIYRNYDCSACTLNFRSELELEKHKPLCRVLPLEAMLAARQGPSGLANGSHVPNGSHDEVDDGTTEPDGFYPEVMVKEEPVEDELADGYDDDDEDIDPRVTLSKLNKNPEILLFAINPIN